MANYEIITDHKWKQFKYGAELPNKVFNDDFDWMNDDDKHDGFISYRGRWYHLSEFMRADRLYDKYDGVLSDTMFSGVLIKISDDCENYQIATIYS